MTTTAAGRKQTSACNGVTTAFGVSFAFEADSDLLVYLHSTAAFDPASATLLTEGVHYTISGSGPARTAVVNTIATYAAGQFVTRFRLTSKAQGADFVAGDGIGADKLETAFDRLALVDEEIADDVANLGARTLVAPVGETLTPLPPAAARAGRFLVWDAQGNPAASVGGGADSGLRTDLAAAPGAALVGYQPAGGGVPISVQGALRRLPFAAGPYLVDSPPLATTLTVGATAVFSDGLAPNGSTGVTAWWDGDVWRDFDSNLIAKAFFLNYTIALGFNQGQYRTGATLGTVLSAVPGFTFTRSGTQTETDADGNPAVFAVNTPAILSRLGFFSRPSPATDMAANLAVASGDDYIFWASGVFDTVSGSADGYLGAMGDGTSNNTVGLKQSAGSAALDAVVTVAGTLQDLGTYPAAGGYSVSGGQIGLGQAGAVLVRRRGGKFTRLIKDGLGSVMIGAEGTSSSSPTVTKLFPGADYTGGAQQLRGPLQSIGLIKGTFSNLQMVQQLLQNTRASYGCYIGDSISAVYLTYPSVPSLIKGLAANILACPGETVAQQKTRFDLVPTAAIADFQFYVLDPLANDLDPTEAASVAIARQQALVNDIAAKKAVGSRIYVAQVPPLRARLMTLYGATNGPLAYAKWLAINDAIAGNGPTPITGVSGRITAHVALMNDGAGNLLPALNTGPGLGDGIHPNTAGRQIIADAVRAVLVADGYLV